MKKSIIAAGAASVALAAMPIVGAFAAANVTDNITASVGAGCTVSGSTTNAVAFSNMTPGQVSEVSSDGVSINCTGNDWTITAKANGTTDYEDKLYNSAAASSSISTGTSGADSYWAFKLTVANSSVATASITTGYTDYHTIPDTTGVVVATGTTAGAATIIPTYKVSLSPTQVNGTYTGSVLYTAAITE